MTITEARGWGLRTVEKLITTVAPGGDIDPCFLICTPIRNVACMLDRSILEDPTGLNRFVDDIAVRLAQREMATSCALITGAWALDLPEIENKGWGAWQACPAKPDAIVMFAIGPTKTEVWWRLIARHEDRAPEIGPWYSFDNPPSPPAKLLRQAIGASLN